MFKHFRIERPHIQGAPPELCSEPHADPDLHHPGVGEGGGDPVHEPAEGAADLQLAGVRFANGPRGARVCPRVQAGAAVSGKCAVGILAGAFGLDEQESEAEVLQADKEVEQEVQLPAPADGCGRSEHRIQLEGQQAADRRRIHQERLRPLPRAPHDKHVHDADAVQNVHTGKPRTLR